MEAQKKINKGFSLIELLVAMTILSIILVSVVQFMSTSSGALNKTKRNLNLQTEAMEVGEQMADSLAQATYIRVGTKDKKTYKLDNQLVDKRKKRTESPEGSLTGELVVDNFPNYLPGSTDKKIILDDINYTLLVDGTSGAAYLDGGTSVQSFRCLTKNAGELLYVKPEYIYLRYQKKVSGSESEAYVIYYFKDKEIYMARGEMSELGTLSSDGYNEAVSKVSAKTGEDGLLTKNFSDCYFSADSKKNTVFIDMLMMDSRYNQYKYNYVETVLLRNSNVLTVPPQKMYKKK
ncbi:MAG: type II secretion system GspH family protein [Lachnospiraceae bacterium]|nr:type II secretion system GspH family protein [Lachnospiraceae bacterium]